MQEFLLTKSDDLTQIAGYVCDHFDGSQSPLKIKITNNGKRSLSQNAFIHVIFQDISKYLISKGRTDWTPEYTKKCLKNYFLGWEDEEYIDIKTAEKLHKSVLRKTSTLSKGELFDFTEAILAWSESIGCFIEIPENCEYMELRNMENA